MAAKITFSRVSKNIRRNNETGVEIHGDVDGYTIFRKDRETGKLEYWGSEDSFHGAMALGTERVEMVREQNRQDAS